jgi:hypothetical protein
VVYGCENGSCQWYEMCIAKCLHSVGNRMLSFIDHRLRITKQVHNQFMGGLDVIMINDFYQTPPIQNSWIFSSKNIGFTILAKNFWHKNV